MAGKKLGHCTVACSVLLLAAVTTADWALKTELWTVSADIQHQLQSSLPAAAGVFRYLAIISLVVTAVPQCLLFYFSSAYTGLQFAVISALSLGLSGLLKMVYREPRPYWVFEDVQGLTCLKGWGTPSGHALYTSAVWGCVAVYLWQSNHRGFALLSAAWIILVGVDRLYVGAHFLSQVVLGWAWGCVLVTVYSAYLHAHSRVTQRSVGLWLALCGSLVAASWYAGQLEYEWSEDWSVRVAESCGVNVVPPTPQAGSAIESARIAFVAGVVVGYYFTQEGRVYPSLETQSTKWSSLLCVLAVLVLLCEAGVSKLQTAQLLKETQSDTVGWALAIVVSAVSGFAFSGLIPRLARQPSLLTKK